LDFKEKILDFIYKSEFQIKNYQFSNSDIQQINKLVKDKYSTWDWNFGYSPKYSFEKSIRIDNSYIDIEMNVEKGFIKNLRIQGHSDKFDFSLVEQRLVGVKHEEKSVYMTLIEILNRKLIPDTTLEEFSKSFF